MNTRKYMKRMLCVFCVLLIFLTGYLLYEMNVYGTRWLSSPYNQRLSQQKKNVIPGSILDRNGEVLAESEVVGERAYHESRMIREATSHVVGDNYGQTYGIETLQSEHLLGLDQSFFSALNTTWNHVMPRGNDVQLTIDAELCEYIYGVMADYEGAVVLMNYKTGEILASVSKPAFDPKYMDDFLQGNVNWDESALVNRTNMGRYTPGSTFKIVTMLAALRYLDDVQSRTFLCDGPLVFDAKTLASLPDVHITAETDEKMKQEQKAGMDSPLGRYHVLRDYNGDYHGEITLKNAFAKSCNHVFAQLALEIGTPRLAQTAKDLGIGVNFLFEDMLCYESQYEKANTDLNLAWSGIGQYKDLMTPLHMCMLSAAVANEGVMMEPQLIYHVLNGSHAVESMSLKKYDSVMSANEAHILQEFMVACVENGTGRKADVPGFVVGGKTGTAEISSIEEERPNAWFTGFVFDDGHPLAICVVLEQGGSGGSNAAPIAGKIFEKAIELGY